VEYLAFGLLALGVLFIFIGIMSGLNKTQQPSSHPPAETTTSETSVDLPSPLLNQEVKNNHPHVKDVSIHLSRENPLFFKKDAYFYLDYNLNNTYNGVQSSFKIMDTTGIRRFGEGEFSYNGFTFSFSNSKTKEDFPLEDVSHISVYPNCIALSFKTKNPVALFFVDNTHDIRSIIDTFRVNNVS